MARWFVASAALLAALGGPVSAFIPASRVQVATKAQAKGVAAQAYAMPR
jgi:hypothetical protein